MKTLMAVVVLSAMLSVPGSAEDRNVLVEMFTNSHCSLCPPAHASLKAYETTNPNATHIRHIYYHVPFPYPDDPLSQVAPADAAGRNQYYGPFSATPVTFFDGVNQGTAYASWGTSLDARVAVSSPLTIMLDGSRNGNTITISAMVQADGTLPGGQLVIHFVLVENVDYVGRNGVSPQNAVMRKMITGSAGEAFAIANGETRVVEKSTDLTNVSMADRAGVVVFVQESATKTVLQSEFISYGILAGVDADASERPVTFGLEQNFPNPFNPSTTIEYGISGPGVGEVRLAVYDLLGREVAVLVNRSLQPGRYTVEWDAGGLASGVYVYRLSAGNAVETKRMLHMK